MNDEPACVEVRFQNDLIAREFYEWMIVKLNLYLFIDSLYQRDFPDLQCSWDAERKVINVQVAPNDEYLS